MGMENQLLLFMGPVQLALATTSMLLLMGFLFTLYYKERILQARPRLSLISPQDNRRMPRVKRHSTLELEDAAGHIDASAPLVDISLGGVCFGSPLRLKKGDPIQARLRSSKEWLLEMSGLIVWMKPEGLRTLYGFKIQKVTESRR